MLRKGNLRILKAFGLGKDALALRDGGLLKQLEVIRFVPERRCVCRAIWQEKQAVYAKLYFGKRAEHYALRDVAGIRYLQNAKIATPDIVWQGKVDSPACYAVIFEAIVTADNAENVWQKSKENARVGLAKKLVQTVAQHHVAGLVQTDLYLKNFLVDDEETYTIDGDGIRQFNYLSKQKSLENLSVLLSKLDVLMLAEHLPKLLNIYVETSGWNKSLDVDRMKINIDAARRKATNNYADIKVFRQCTDVNITNNANVWAAVSSTYSDLVIPKTPAEADDCFLTDNILKDGNTCTVALAKIDDLRFVIKRYNIKNFQHGLGRALRETRAAVSWANAHRLQLLGIATATPIALIESRLFGLKGRAYFMTEYIDAPDMIAFFKQTSDKALRAQATKALAQLFYRLYLLKISHGDMKANNIKVQGAKPILIDLDSMQQHRYARAAEKAHAKDLVRFMRNWKDEPSLYNGFVKAFKVVYADHAPLLAANILK